MKQLRPFEKPYEVMPPSQKKCARCGEAFNKRSRKPFFNEFRPIGPDFNDDGNFRVYPSPTCQPCWAITERIRGTMTLNLGRLMRAIFPKKYFRNLEDFNI
jgi:hypothetical protein